ncbi:MAG TPA: DUF481 domain-containing protein, partial [Chitinophagaceae bacterium]
HLIFLATGVVNRTNASNSTVFSQSLAAARQTPSVAINASVGWIYGVSARALTNNDLAAHGDLDLGKHRRRFYPWLLLNYDRAYSLKIRYRLQAGAGIAYSVIDSPHTRIKISDGFLYEAGDLTDVHDVPVTYDLIRNSLRLSYHFLIGKRLTIEGVHFYQPAITSLKDYVIQSTSTISFRIAKWLSITNGLLYNRINRTGRENFLATYGVTIDKYF